MSDELDAGWRLLVHPRFIWVEGMRPRGGSRISGGERPTAPPDLDDWATVGLAVGLSLISVVIWGVLIGSMLPFVMYRVGADPATSSTPFVATIVDVTGLIIYLSVAAVVLN